MEAWGGSMPLEKMNNPSSFSKLIENEPFSQSIGELGLMMPVPPVRFERRYTNDSWHIDTNTLLHGESTHCFGKSNASTG